MEIKTETATSITMEYLPEMETKTTMKDKQTGRKERMKLKRGRSL